MFHQTQSGSVWQASHVSQGHPQMLETADRQTFSRAAGAGGFDARDIHVPEIQSPLSSDTPRYYGSVLLGNEQHYATLPEYRSAGHFHRFNVNQPHQPMDPQAQYRRPFPNPREVLYPLAREPNRPFSAYKGDPSFIWYPISTVSGPPVNQGNLAFVPVSTRNPMFYRRMSEDGQNLGEFQICPRGSEIDPRSESKFYNLDATNPVHVANNLGSSFLSIPLRRAFGPGKNQALFYLHYLNTSL